MRRDYLTPWLLCQMVNSFVALLRNIILLNTVLFPLFASFLFLRNKLPLRVTLQQIDANGADLKQTINLKFLGKFRVCLNVSSFYKMIG